MNTYFAPIPDDQESTVALVTREAQRSAGTTDCLPWCSISCVREAVESLRGSRVTTFVPLLALRRVRACIRAGTCDCDEW